MSISAGHHRGRRPSATVGIIAAAALVGALLSPVLAATPASADPTSTPSALVFTTEPGDGDPGDALAAQPEVTIQDSSGAIVTTSSATITLTLNQVDPPVKPAVSLTCTQTGPDGTASMAVDAGVATFTGCSVPRGGTYTLTATDTADDLSVTSTSFVVSGPAQLAVTGWPTAGVPGAPLPGQLVVTVQDTNRTTLTDSTASIYLVIVPTTGTAGAVLACSKNPVDAIGGVATFSGCSIDKAGTGYQLGVADVTDGFASAPSDPFDVSAGSPAQLVFSGQPFGASGGTAFSGQPVVTVQDADGNTVTDSTDSISLAITANTGTPGAHLTCTGGNSAAVAGGVAAFIGCSIDKAGTGYRLTASDSDKSLSQVSGTFDVGAGGASTVTFAAEPSGGPAGTAFATQPRITVTDAGGNGIAAPVTLALKTGTGTPGATLTCDSTVVTAAADGTATFSGCSIDKTGSGYILTATSGSSVVESQPFGVSKGAVESVSFAIQPGDGTGGTAWGTQPVVQLADSGGEPAAGAVTLTLTPGVGSTDATLRCDANPVSAVDGAASFAGCALDKAGTYRLTATSGTAVATSQPFTVDVGAPAQLAFTTQPGGGTGGTVWATQPIVAVQDAGGNPITASSADVGLQISDGTGSGTLTCTANSLPAVRGLAVFTGCAIDATAGAYTLTATDATDGITAISNTFAVTVGDAAALEFTTQPSGGPAGVAFATPPAVTVVDAGGNPVTDSRAAIGLGLTPNTGASGARLTCDALSVPASSGVAPFTGCAVDTAAGGYTITATDAFDGLSAESLPFTVSAPPPTPLGVAPVGVPAGQTMGGSLYGVNPTNTVDHVNTATGALTFSATDLRVAGIGEPLVVQRTYNSGDTTGGSFGLGWTSVLDAGVTILNPRTAIVRGEDGQQLVFTNPSGGKSWTAPPGAQSTLDCTGTSCVVTRFDGVQLLLNRNANGTTTLTNYQAPDKQGLAFAWGPRTVTITVDTTNKLPYQVVATLDASGHVTKISTPAGRSVSYSYTGNLLTSVTDANGNAWAYSYTSGLLTRQSDPTGAARLTATYDGTSSRVSAVRITGGPQHADDTVTWDPGTQTATITALATVNGARTRVTSADRYVGNVLVQQTQPNGAVTRYSYDANVDLVEMQDPLGWIQQFAYDKFGNLISQTTPTGKGSSTTASMTYDPAHRLLTQTDASGATTGYVYQGAYLVTIIPPGSAGQTQLTYNKAGLLIGVAGPTISRQFSYDAAGNRTGVVTLNSAGKPLNGKGTVQVYDEAGNLTSSTTAIGNTNGPKAAYTTTWSYDANGNRLSTTVPGRGTTGYTYTPAGDLASATQPNGAVTSYGWDEGSLTRTITGSGITTLAYDPSGHLLDQTSPTGQGTHYAYDAAGQTVATTSADGVTVRQTWDLLGNPVLVTDSAGNTVAREFDAQGREVRRVSNGAATLTGYDAAGNVVSSTDPGGNVTTATYTPAGQVASVTTAAGTTGFGYDAAGDLTSVTDPSGNRTTYGYQAPHQPTSMTVAAGTTLAATTSYSYDLDGRVVKTIDPDGRTTTETLDAAGDPTTTGYSQTGQQSITVTRSYDALGRLTSMNDGTGTHSYTYDDAGNLVAADGFSYDYTTTPGQITETYPDGTAITNMVDDAGNLMSMTSGTEGIPGYVSVAYLRNGQRQTIGIASSNGVLQTRTLDAQGNIVGQQAQNATGQLTDDTLTYDANGNPLSQTITADGAQTVDAYGYDGAGRVTSFATATQPVTATDQPDDTAPALRGSAAAFVTPQVAGQTAATVQPATTGSTPAIATPTAASMSQVPTSALQAAGPAPQLSVPAADVTTGTAATAVDTAEPAAAPASATAPAASTYTYDGAGNRTAAPGVTSRYNARGELTSSTDSSGTTTTYGYDKQGNLTSVTGPHRSQTFGYDAADHLITVTTTSGGTNTTVTYAYDGDGNRISATTGGQTTDYLWDPAANTPRLALEENAAGDPIRRYFYGEGPVAMQVVGTGSDAPTATYFYQVDPMGNVTALTDGDGNLAATYHYDPYGQMTTDVPATAPDNPLLFQGQFLDAATGLYLMGARNYDPATGRFTQPDPVTPSAASAATSPYVFADDNPLVNADPTGRTSVKDQMDSVFWGSSDTTVNVANDVKYGIKGAYISFKVGNYIATSLATKTTSAAEQVSTNVAKAAGPTGEIAGEVGSGAGEIGAVAGEAGEVLASTSTLSKFANAGTAVAVIGFALQTYVTVQDCRSGDTYKCAGDVVGEAVAIGFFVGCTILTAGTAAVLCSIAGTIISVGLQEVVTLFGPQIYSGLVSGYNATAAGLTQATGQTVQGFLTAGKAISGFTQSAGGAIASGFNQTTTAISSGFDGMVSTLVGTWHDAAAFGGMLKNTFNAGADEVASTMIDFGYDVGDVATALYHDFNMDAEKTAAFLRDGYGYTASAVAGGLTTAYGYTGDQVASALKDAGYTAGEIASVLSDSYGYAVDQTAKVLNTLYGNLNDGLTITAAALQRAYSDAAQDVTDALKTLGYTATEVAGQLRSLYNEAGQDAATALKDAGYAATEVGTALQDVYADGVQAAATVLKGVGYTVDEVATALKEAYALADTTAATALNAVGYLAGDVAGALQSVYTDPGAAVTAALKAGGYAADAVATAVYDVFASGDFTADVNSVAAWMGVAEFPARQVASALYQALGAPDGTVAAALNGAGFAVDQVADAVGYAFGDAAAEVAAALKAGGYAVADISQALSDVYQLSAAQLATVLKGLSYDIDTVTAELQSVYGLGAPAVADALKAAGYAAADVASLLQNYFGESASTIYNTLKGLYTDLSGVTGDIVSGWNSFTSGAESVWHSATSWL